jgi:hypothetical protein
LPHERSPAKHACPRGSFGCGSVGGGQSRCCWCSHVCIVCMCLHARVYMYHTHTHTHSHTHTHTHLLTHTHTHTPGCPCLITKISPTGGIDEGGFNVSVTVQGLDTGRSSIGGLSCLFDEQLQVFFYLIFFNLPLGFCCLVDAQTHTHKHTHTHSIPHS